MEEEKLYRFKSYKLYIFLDGEYIRVNEIESIWNILFNNKCLGKWMVRKYGNKIEKNSRDLDRNVRYEIQSPYNIYNHLNKAINILKK